MRIFVSSTYDDLKDHRRAVDLIINRISHQYKGMEYFGSRSEEPKKVCFDEISKCEIFIGIYAHRYGWVPQNESLSITEQEFGFALEKKLKCFCYIVDQNYPWSPSLIEIKNKSRLKQFYKKVNKLVRSTFTTPDNLASQIAADLVRTSQEKLVNRDNLSLKEQIYFCCEQEIKTSIGSKYIKGLYVRRKLENQIRKSIKEVSNLTIDLKMLYSELLELKEFYESVDFNNKQHEITHNDEDKGEKEYQFFINKLVKNIDHIQSYSNLMITDDKLCYPSNIFTSELDSIKSDLSSFKSKSIDKYFDYSLKNKVTSLSDKIYNTISEINNKYLPITLIIDRAGGGKTNLLCRLSESFSKSKYCFFFAAKSIIEPNVESIISYLNSVYPISPDPILCAIEQAKKENEFLIVIVDGINENLHPIDFNAAIKKFIRRYYNMPVRFIISCRDIYWKYFKDDWWYNHANKVYSDELYTFSKSEFKKAIPLYLEAYKIHTTLSGNASIQLQHPLLLRFFCEAYQGDNKHYKKIGEIVNISLLTLFDLYCNRKFSHISERLKMLSADDVYLFVEMIAKLMLSNKIRLLPIELIGEKAKIEFNEGNIRVLSSRYVQVLDEDILIEEKPFGVNMNIKVGFVYDEFLEYILAKAYWRENINKKNELSLNKIIELIDSLILLEKEFISVIGIISYLGEIVVSFSQSKGLKLIDYLISKNEQGIALKILSRWPDNSRNDKVFSKLEYLYNTSNKPIFRNEVWREIINVSTKQWELFIKFIRTLPLKGYQKPVNVFSALRLYNGGDTYDRQTEVAQYIYETFQKYKYIVEHKGELDYKSGIITIKEIYKNNSASWSTKEKYRFQILMNKILSL